MSSASVTSSKREKESAELLQELESAKSLNASLKAYLEHLRLFKKSIKDINSNCKVLKKVNTDWLDTMVVMKQNLR